MFAFDFDRLANQAGDGICAFGGGGEGDFGDFAIGAFDFESLGCRIEGLEFAFVGDDFSAACESGRNGDCDEGDQGEELFHRFCGLALTEADLFSLLTESKGEMLLAGHKNGGVLLSFEAFKMGRHLNDEEPDRIPV